MYEPNVRKILDALRSTDLVLDVGGWACPFNRADHVLDAEPYSTRGYYATVGLPASQGGEGERFTQDTWAVRDICDRTPWPYRDGQFDFVICSHVLEDIRDPLWVCSELMRVGKRGYIEVPSREYESCRGVERPGQVGLSHHRWLVEVGEGELRFFQKYHLIHTHWRFSLPAGHARKMDPARKVSWLWWEGPFAASEVTIHGIDRIEAELEQFVGAARPYPAWRLGLDRWSRRAGGFASRAAAAVARRLKPREGQN